MRCVHAFCMHTVCTAHVHTHVACTLHAHTHDARTLHAHTRTAGRCCARCRHHTSVHAARMLCVHSPHMQTMHAPRTPCPRRHHTCCMHALHSHCAAGWMHDRTLQAPPMHAAPYPRQTHCPAPGRCGSSPQPGRAAPTPAHVCPPWPGCTQLPAPQCHCR